VRTELAELFEFICDDAGMSIDYWAVEATNEPSKKTYSVKVNPDFVGGNVQDKVISYQELYEACEKVAKGEVSANPATKSICEQIVSSDSDVDYQDIDYDATDADVIVQVAMFGEIVFG
jgi:hypothetical protein